MTTADAHLADLSVAELVRRTSEQEVSARRGRRGLPGPDRRAGPRAERVLRGAGRRGPGRGRRARPLPWPPGTRPGRCTACPSPSRRRSTSPAASPPSAAGPTPPRRAADGEVVRRLRAAGAVIIGKTRMPEFGQWPYTESVDGGYTRNPWNPAHTPGGSSGGTAVAVAAGHGAGRHRRRRRRLDPDPVGLLRAVRPQAPARPGDDGADGAPLVGAGHGRAADPVGARLRARLRRHPRHHRRRSCSAPRNRRPPSPRRRGAEPRRLRIGWSTKSRDQGPAPRPGARAGRPRDRPAAHRPRPRGASRSTRATPTRRWRSCRSSSPACAPRATPSSTTTGSRSAPARPTGSAAGSRPGVVRWALRAGEKVAAQGQPGLRRRSTCC